MQGEEYMCIFVCVCAVILFVFKCVYVCIGTCIHAYDIFLLSLGCYFVSNVAR